jgi:hypothetical protein
LSEPEALLELVYYYSMGSIMIAEISGQQLHDRATRGESLSAEERIRLDAWYASQDQSEADAMGRASEPFSMAALRAKVDAAVAQLSTVAQQIQRLTTENEAVRSEIADLQTKLSQNPAASRR